MYVNDGAVTEKARKCSDLIKREVLLCTFYAICLVVQNKHITFVV